MTNYVGIDLGTSNSAICSFDGRDIRLYLSPEQHEVTPSAIFITSRGSKYLGKRAYDQAARSPENAATLFKRLMGTSTPIALPGAGVTITPEECSAEILRVLYAYLPEELRADPTTGTVITVPAAFNQMQKDATRAAAELAGIGKVALMQEPVAAVMSVMRQTPEDGTFLVYDLGGGTLDIAVAQSVAGRVSLLAHGGIEMCGGRDFDRALRDTVALPWLRERFDLPDPLAADPRFKPLVRLAEWACERAKIDLSMREEAMIALDESELRLRDQAGADLYLDIPLERSRFDALIEPLILQSVAAARATLEKAGIGATDVGRIVFVGGPTHYRPLRDRIARELGIAASTEVKPMTAVAEGAAVFAESIDWSSESRGRKRSREKLSMGASFDLAFNYVARTPNLKSKVALKLAGAAPAGVEIQVDSLDTGWSSGRIAVKDGATFDVPLSKLGDNLFKVFLFGADGVPQKLQTDRITIARTAASIDAIPASHTIGVEALSRSGGRPVLVPLVTEGEQLPKKGREVFKAGNALPAGTPGAIRFKLWEGDIADPVHDNRFIGCFEITGKDFDAGVVAAGADLVCEYEILDSGNIMLEVTVPSIGSSFHGGRNFYSRQQGQIDYTQASQLLGQEIEQTAQRVDETAGTVTDDRLAAAREKLDRASALAAREGDPESAKEAMDRVQEARRLLAVIRKSHLHQIRRLELDKAKDYFDRSVRQYARPSESSAFDNLVRTAQRSIDNVLPDFESHLSELWGRVFQILWRQDWFVIDRFKRLVDQPHLFPDARQHAALVAEGEATLATNDMDKLREATAKLDAIRYRRGDEDEMLVAANIVRA